uniref:Cell division control protein 10 n=1 Tax=Lygus hesperus TaxID=30085 RepID=A0A0A9YL75_LYGHE
MVQDDIDAAHTRATSRRTKRTSHEDVDLDRDDALSHVSPASSAGHDSQTQSQRQRLDCHAGMEEAMEEAGLSGSSCVTYNTLVDSSHSSDTEAVNSSTRDDLDSTSSTQA